MKTSELINKLTEESAPVRVIPSIGSRLAVWLAAGIFMALMGLAMMGVRSDFSDVASHSYYYWECGALIGLMLGGALWALRLSIPGREPSSKFIYLPLFLGAVWAGLVAVRLFTGPFGWSDFRFNFDTHYPCGIAVFGLSLLPNIYLSRSAGQSYPLHKGLTGILIGCASGAVGALAMQVICGLNHPPHLLVWHGIPVFLSGLLGWFFSKKMYPPVR